MRAYRTTLPRLAVSRPVDTNQMQVRRRISATFKDLPGGQVLGPTFDYTHRLLDFSLAQTDSKSDRPAAPEPDNGGEPVENEVMPKVTDMLDGENLIEKEKPEDDQETGDITRNPLSFPAERDVRLQCLARADEGFLLSLGYSVQRGFGHTHPFVGEIRMGSVGVSIVPEELGFEIEIGEITLTECEMINQFRGSKELPPQFTRGYGLSFGFCERKAMSMALVDRALRSRELGEEVVAPAQDEEFVLYHGDNVEASGFTGHLKLPHHVDFQSELELVRNLKTQTEKNQGRNSDE